MVCPHNIWAIVSSKFCGAERGAFDGGPFQSDKAAQSSCRMERLYVSSLTWFAHITFWAIVFSMFCGTFICDLTYMARPDSIWAIVFCSVLFFSRSELIAHGWLHLGSAVGMSPSDKCLPSSVFGRRSPIVHSICFDKMASLGFRV